MTNTQQIATSRATPGEDLMDRWTNLPSALVRDRMRERRVEAEHERLGRRAHRSQAEGTRFERIVRFKRWIGHAFIAAGRAIAQDQPATGGSSGTESSASVGGHA
jgi:hypothetical protein